MILSDQERAVLIRDLCKRLGSWSAMDQPFSASIMDSIRANAERLVEVLDARELSLYRKRLGGPPREWSEEG